MKIIIIALFSIIMLIGCLSFGQTDASSVLAKSDYQSGYNHGLSDGKDSCTHPTDVIGTYYSRIRTLNSIRRISFMDMSLDSVVLVLVLRVTQTRHFFDCARGPHSAGWITIERN